MYRTIIPVKKCVIGVWKDISSMDDVLERIGIDIKVLLKVVIGDGGKTNFWNDRWLGSFSLRERFPVLFKQAANKTALVKDNYQMVDGVATWKWDWIGGRLRINSLQSFEEVKGLLEQKTLGLHPDAWVWDNSSDFPFSTKCLRWDIMVASDNVETAYLFLWIAWAPIKYNILLWRALMGRVAAKVELEKRGVQVANSLCDRCGLHCEDVDHLFVGCLFAKRRKYNITGPLESPHSR